MKSRSKKKALSIVAIQLLLTAIVGFFCLVWEGYSAAFSGIVGGAIAVIPSAIQALWMFHFRGARAAGKFIKAFYYSEMMKLILVACLFAMVFNMGNVAILPMFIGFIAAEMGFWIAPLVLSL